MTFFEGPDMNTHSAWRAAKARPAGDVPRLIQDRGALRRRLGKVQGVELVVRPIVTDATHPVGSREDALADVGNDGVVGPTALPQFIDDRHIVFGDLISIVVPTLAFFTHALGRAVEIASHHVPADPAFCQMIEGGHPAREGEGRFVG